MADDAGVLLVGAGQEARYIHQVDQWNSEGIAELDEAGGLVRSVDVQASAHRKGLIGNYAHAVPAQAAEAGDNVVGIIGLQLHYAVFI